MASNKEVFSSKDSFTMAAGTFANLAAAPAAVDVGHMSIKVVYVETNPGHDILHCVTFPAAQLGAALDFLKSKVNLKNGGRLHVTGLPVSASMIRERCGLEAVNVMKMPARVSGTHFLIGHARLEELEIPHVEVKGWDFSSSMMQKFMDMFEEHASKSQKAREAEQQATEPQTTERFPAMIIHNGFMETVWQAEGPKLAKGLVSNSIAAPTINGLSDLLVKAGGGFEALSDLSQRGRVQNIDTEVKEIMSNDPNSPYGKFPPDMPVFPFGKAYDHNKGLDEFAKEDVAASLLHFFTGISLMNGIGFVMASGIKQIYVGGSLYSIPEVRRSWDEYYLTYFQGMGIQTTFVKLQHACAVGALLANGEGKVVDLEVERL